MEYFSSLVIRVMIDIPITKNTSVRKCNMLLFYVTQQISKVKLQAGDGAQLIGCLPSVLVLTVNLTACSHLREELPRGD